MNRASTRNINCCFHCGLPLPSNKKGKGSYEKSEQRFCCSGCYLVSQITRSSGEEADKRILAGRFIIGFILSMNVFLLSFPFYGGNIGSVAVPEEFANPLRFVLFILSLPVLLILGYPLTRTAIETLRRGSPGIEPLILLGSLAAFLVSVKTVYQETGNIYFETVTMVLTLYTLGRFIEANAKSKATGFIKGLASIMPDQVTVINKSGETDSIATDSIIKGQSILIKPGERIPVDGQIEKGSGSVDESFFTGESQSVRKSENDMVISGTLNLDGSLVVKVINEPRDFLVQKIVRLMEEIKANTPPIKRIGDTIATIFIPIVSTLALSTFFFFAMEGRVEEGILRMLSIILISCPCAFGLSAPLAIWKGFSIAAQQGVIIKSPYILEQLGRVKTVFFDKTGTITDQTLLMQDVYSANALEHDEVLSIAAALEVHSTHPIAHSILQEAKKRAVPIEPAKEVRVYPGFGVEGIVVNQEYRIGGRKWIEEKGATFTQRYTEKIEQYHSQAVVSTILGQGNTISAIIFFTQNVRESFREALLQLETLGINRTLLTGDTGESVEKLNVKSLFNNVRIALSPIDKVEEIEKEALKHEVVMVGDGLNDAPALEASSIGIAMGCGSDLTRESAKINLLGNNLQLVPELIKLSRAIRRRIFGNYIWALGYNFIGIYLAMSGSLTPLFAVSAMILSSLFVIGNSLRSYTHFKSAQRQAN